jgi:integrase
MTKRQLPNGMTQRGSVYWADFRANGRRVRKSLSRNLKTARQLLIELRARAERGDFGLLDNDVRTAELKNRYLRHIRQTKKSNTTKRYETDLATILPQIPPQVSAITEGPVLEFREQRLAGGCSPATVNANVGTLCAMLNWGVKCKVIGSNPLAGIEPIPDDKPKEGRALDPEEVDQLLSVSPPHWRNVWYAFLVTGLRATELASLRWSDIDWEHREIVVQRDVAKNHRPRRIPIDNELWAILKERRGQGEYVFLNTRGRPYSRCTLYQAFIRWCEKAGIEGNDRDGVVDLHSLRRTFATELILRGADPKTVQELLGHRTLAMTMSIYAKVRRSNTREAVARLGYGRGVEAPAHIVPLPDGHRIPPAAENVGAKLGAASG